VGRCPHIAIQKASASSFFLERINRTAEQEQTFEDQAIYAHHGVANKMKNSACLKDGHTILGKGPTAEIEIPQNPFRRRPIFNRRAARPAEAMQQRKDNTETLARGGVAPPLLDSIACLAVG
jgi:hypothetical protein